MESKTMKTRISAVAVALAMLLSLVPMMVLADDAYGMQGAQKHIQMINPSDITVNSATDTEYVNTLNAPVALTDGKASFQFKMDGFGGNIKNAADKVVAMQGKVDAGVTLTDANGSAVSGSALTVTAVDTSAITFDLDVSGLASNTSYILTFLPSFATGGGNWTLDATIKFNFTTAGETEPDPEPAVTPFTLSTSEVTIEKGKNTSWITINNYQADVHGTLTFKSANEEIATVFSQPNPRFRITGVGVGTTEVVVSSEDGKTTATCSVTVTAPGAQYMAMNKTSLLLNSGETDTLSAIVLPKDAVDKTVTWSSSDENAATVDENGLVTSVNGGTATITATSTTNNSVKATCVVNPVEESITNLQDKLKVEGNNEVLRLYFTSPSAPNYTATHLSNGDYWNVATESQNSSYKDGRAQMGVNFTLGPYRTGVLTINNDTAEFAKYLYDKVTLYGDKELTDVIGTFTETNQNVIDLTSKNNMLFYDLSLDKTYYVKFSKDIIVDGVPLGSNIILEFHTRKPMDSLTLDRTELTLAEGETDKLKATGSGPDGYQNETSLIWSSSDESVVTVDNKGNLTAVDTGSATITAKAPLSGKTATCAVTVEKPKPTLVSSEGAELKARTNTTLTLENAPTGEGYTYKFIVYNETTNQWYKLKDFGPETTFDWYTGPKGVKNLYVDIKDAENNVTRVALEGVNVTDSDLAVKSFTIAPEGVLPTKSQATLTAEAEKGEGPYEYKFIVYNKTSGQWYKLKDFGPEAKFDWYTGPEGDKILYVDVKDATGKVVRGQLPVSVK